MSRPKDLPDFGKPPVVETVLSLQFEPISNLTSAHIGLLWARFRHSFPVVEEHPPLPPVFEKFELPSPLQLDVSIEEKPPSPRIWFVNKEKTELIQIQSDRFIHNWRKMEGIDPYPHYEPTRDKFRSELAVLEEFLARENLGTLSVNQCEVTYVNHIEASGAWNRHGQLENVFSPWSGIRDGSFLPAPEDIGIRLRFVIPDATGKPVGRLHAVVQAAWRKDGNVPILILNLIARGRPIGEGIEGAFKFFELGRRWIVKGFADLTTPQMHGAWERTDDTNV